MWLSELKYTFISDPDTGDIAAVNTSGQMHVVSRGTIDSSNSTLTPLPGDTGGSDHIFTGASIDTLDYGVIKVAVYSDVASAIDGLEVQQSIDQTNWHFTDAYTIPATTGKVFSPQPSARYVRLVYTNGVVAQSAFQLSLMLKKTYVQASSHRVDDTVSGNDDTELVTAIMKVKTNDETTYKNVDVQNPLPTDGDSIYPKDIYLANSTIGTFTGSLENLFGADDYITPLTDSSATNPKYFDIDFRRSIGTSVIGITTNSGSFSNIKIILKSGDGTTLRVIDTSTDDTDRTLYIATFQTTGFSCMRVEFHTADAVTISSVSAPKIATVISELRGESDITGVVENVKTYKGALQVESGLKNTTGVIMPFSRDVGASTTLNGAVTAGDTDIVVTDATGITVGNEIRIPHAGTPVGNLFFTITVVVSNTLTLDREVALDVDDGEDVIEISTNLNAVGTLTSPILYRITPPAGLKWEMSRILITMTSSTVMDDAKFGGISALINGATIRVVNSGSVAGITNWKSNGDLMLDMGIDVWYSDKAPAGSYGLRGRWTFTKAGFVVAINGDNSDYGEVSIQDDLSGLDTFKVNVQGRLAGG